MVTTTTSTTHADETVTVVTTTTTTTPAGARINMVTTKNLQYNCRRDSYHGYYNNLHNIFGETVAMVTTRTTPQTVTMANTTTR